MLTGTSRLGRITNTDDGYALYQLEFFTHQKESVGWVVLRAQIVNGQPDPAESEDIRRVLQREASRRGFPVAAE